MMTAVQRDTNPATYSKRAAMSFMSEAMSEVQPFAGAYEQPFKVVETLTEAMAPVEAFERMKAVAGEDGTLKPGYEAAPLRTVDPAKRMKENRMEPITVHRRQRL